MPSSLFSGLSSDDYSFGNMISICILLTILVNSIIGCGEKRPVLTHKEASKKVDKKASTKQSPSTKASNAGDSRKERLRSGSLKSPSSVKSPKTKPHHGKSLKSKRSVRNEAGSKKKVSKRKDLGKKEDSSSTQLGSSARKPKSKKSHRKKLPSKKSHRKKSPSKKENAPNGKALDGIRTEDLFVKAASPDKKTPTNVDLVAPTSKKSKMDSVKKINIHELPELRANKVDDQTNEKRTEYDKPLPIESEMSFTRTEIRSREPAQLNIDLALRAKNSTSTEMLRSDPPVTDKTSKLPGKLANDEISCDIPYFKGPPVAIKVDKEKAMDVLMKFKDRHMDSERSRKERGVGPISKEMAAGKTDELETAEEPDEPRLPISLDNSPPKKSVPNSPQKPPSNTKQD